MNEKELFATLLIDRWGTEDVWTFRTEMAARRAMAANLISRTNDDPRGNLSIHCVDGFKKGTGVKPKHGEVYKLTITAEKVEL